MPLGKGAIRAPGGSAGVVATACMHMGERRNTGPQGLLASHGIYDYFDSAGFMTLGTSRKTSAFVCDAIALA